MSLAVDFVGMDPIPHNPMTLRPGKWGEHIDPFFLDYTVIRNQSFAPASYCLNQHPLLGGSV